MGSKIDELHDSCFKMLLFYLSGKWQASSVTSLSLCCLMIAMVRRMLFISDLCRVGATCKTFEVILSLLDHFQIRQCPLLTAITDLYSNL